MRENKSIAGVIKKKKKQPNKKMKNSKDDQNKKQQPKKPPTAFFYYLEDFRKAYQAENPAVKTMRDIGKACGMKWKTMNFEEKVQYYDIATQKRAEYEKALAAYIKRRESGELSEETEDEYE